MSLPYRQLVRAMGGSGGTVPPAKDAVSNIVTTSSGTTLPAMTITTTTGCLLLCFIEVNTVAVQSIANTAGLTWASRAISTGSNHLELWYATAPAPLTGDQITVTCNGTITFAAAQVVAVSGTHATPFDSSSTAASGTVSFTTTAANCLLIAGYRIATANPTAGAGWTQTCGQNFLLVEYRTVTTTQSGLVATITTGDTLENGGIAAAIKGL